MRGRPSRSLTDVLNHFRLTVPADLVGEVSAVLMEHDCVTNVTVQAEAVVRPPGDLVEFDVAREKASELLTALNEIGLDQRGAIVISAPASTPFKVARDLNRLAPGHPDDAVIWESVITKAYEGSVPTLSYHVFLVIAVALAGIAVVTDSAVLVVGAMVVGPEFTVIAAACAGLVLGHWALVGRSLLLLVLSFLFAIAVVTVLALLMVLTGGLTAEQVTAPRPNTGFIWHPDKWSFIVALLAGVAGALALALEKSATMVGVFISVTTVPAAGNLALGIAVWDADETLGSLAQLGANIAGMLISGTMLLLLVRTTWPWLASHTERIFGARSHT